MSPFLRKHRNIIVTSFLTGLALTIYLSNTQTTDTASSPRKAILTVYSPLLRAITYPLKEAKRLWDNYIFLLAVQDKNIKLQESVALLVEQNMQMKELLSENKRLRKLLSLKEGSPTELISAEIIGRDPIGWFKTLLINKGSDNGIKKNLAVITHQGVTGRILGVAANNAKVLMLTDINSSVDALVQRTRARGIVEGRASNLCELKYVSATDDVRSGDLVVTSGLCGIFPKGLPIGRVNRVEKDSLGLFQHVELTPCASLDRLEEVCIVLDKR